MPRVENLFVCWVQSNTGCQRSVISGGGGEGQAELSSRMNSTLLVWAWAMALPF